MGGSGSEPWKQWGISLAECWLAIGSSCVVGAKDSFVVSYVTSGLLISPYQINFVSRIIYFTFSG